MYLSSDVRCQSLFLIALLDEEYDQGGVDSSSYGKDSLVYLCMCRRWPFL